MQWMWKVILTNGPFAQAGMGAHLPALVISKKRMRNRSPHSFLSPLPVEIASAQTVIMLLEVKGSPNYKHN